MNLLFVVNPVAGGTDKAPFLQEATSICDQLGIQYHLFYTSADADEERLARVLTSFKPDRVASVGGDGTLLFTATALLSNPVPLGVVPMGSANAVATDFLVPSDPVNAFQQLIDSELVTGLDMLTINDEHHSLHFGDVGINAQIVSAYDADDDRGMMNYAKYFVDELLKTESFPVRIQYADGSFTEKGVMVGICNCRKFGTGIPLNLRGNPTDGKFEIVVVRAVNISALIKAGLSKFNENFYTDLDVGVFSARKATISFDQPRLLQLDGEVIGEFSEINVELINKAVQFIVHQENPYL